MSHAPVAQFPAGLFKRFGIALTSAATLLVSTVAEGQIGRPEGLYYKSWGVVIGINDYLVAPKLAGAIADGKVAAQTLRELGFDEVVELYDKEASVRRIHSILNDYLPRKVGRQDRVVVFFAGHAGTTTDLRSKELGYLVPWDAQIANASKSVTLDHLKEFARRVMAKHILFVLDAAVSDWEVTPPQPVSLEGRISPEEETDKRAVQILTAAARGEPLLQKNGQGVFLQAMVAGIKGAADENKNGWVMATELGHYVRQQVEAASGGAQHPQFAQLDGDGDGVLVEGKRSAFQIGPEPKTEAERIAAAKEEYEKAFSILRRQRSPQEALDRLNKAIEYSPTYGDAYVLKSYLYLEFLPNLGEALVAAELAVKHAPDNADSHYTLGLVLQRKGQFKEAERALLQALTVNPTYTEAYLSLGDLYAEDLKDQKKSIEAYRQYLKIGGNENRVRTYLEKMGAGTGE